MLARRSACAALLLAVLTLAFCSPLRHASAAPAGGQQLDPELEKHLKEKLKDLPPVPKGQDPSKIPADIFDAIIDDDLHLVQAILHHGESIDQKGQGGQTPLVHAALHGKHNAVAWLLEKGADASIPEDNGWTVMHAAAFAGKPQVVEVLLKHSISPNDQLKDGLMPIHRACWGKEPGHTEVVKVLLNAGVPHDQRTARGALPIDIVKDNNPGTKKLLRKWAKRAQKAKAQGKAPKAEL